MPARHSSDRFVGRERELTKLAVALESAAAGASRRVLLAGEGGIGTSRLITETTRRVALLDEPFRVIRCTALPARGATAYAPIATGFGPWLADLADDELRRVAGPGAEPLARLLPTLAPRLLGAEDRTISTGRTRRDGVAPERRAAWMSEAIHGLLDRAGERQPILLILEDLHHADAATRGLAAFLARVTRPARLCVIARRNDRSRPRLGSKRSGCSHRRTNTSCTTSSASASFDRTLTASPFTAAACSR